MPLFLISAGSIQGDQVLLDAAESHHLSHVLRKKAGEVITLTQGRGEYFEAKIIQTRGNAVLQILSSKRDSHETAPQILLASALLKGPRMDWLVEKATELGVRQILPFTSERCVVKPGGPPARLKKIQRWTRISEAALKQSARPLLPQIGSLLSFSELLDRIRITEALKILFSPNQNREGSANPLQEIVLNEGHSPFWWAVIGPEGGFSPREVSLAKGAGFHLATLGNYTLRAETAALTAVSILNHLKDLSSPGPS
jgi:16S rRNA (uracil1498-N3)-methyltransferase